MNAPILPSVLLLAALAVTPARADDASFAVDRFLFAPASSDLLVVSGARVPEAFALNLSFGLQFASDLLVLERGGATSELVGNGLAVQLSCSVAFGGRYELGAVLPFALARATEGGGVLPAASSAGLEDLRLVPKVRLPSWRGLRFAAAVPVTLPIGKRDALLGEGSVTATPTGVAEYDLGSVRLVGNLGVAIRPERQYYDLTIGSALVYGLGAEYPFRARGWGWAALASAWGEVGFLDSGTGVKPAELDAALRWEGPHGIDLTGGLGTGLIAGYGAPTFRAFLLAGWRPRAAVEPPPAPPPAPPPPDPCAPGQPHSTDQCPALDDDGDGVKNVEDRCPTEPGVVEEQGCAAKPPPPPPQIDPCAPGERHVPEQCPELDDDGDGVKNAADRCPTTPGVAERQGCVPADPCSPGEPHVPEQCPNADDDGDGILNKADRCPTTAGVPEQRGCPPPDPCSKGQKHEPEQCPALDDDGDGFPNGEDRCPLVKGLAAHQGCPPPKAVLTEKRIELKEAVYFDTGKASIQDRSFQLLDDISRILVDNPQVKLVSIEGHTDATGSAERNRVLSQQRAAAVRSHLVRKGIAEERLEAAGFGQDRPVADNKTPAGRALNRRVEFLVK